MPNQLLMGRTANGVCAISLNLTYFVSPALVPSVFLHWPALQMIEQVLRRKTFRDLFIWLCLWKNVTWKMLGEHFLASALCHWSNQLFELSHGRNKVSSADLSAVSSYAKLFQVMKVWAAHPGWVLLGKGHEHERSQNGHGLLVKAILKASHAFAWPRCPEQAAVGERVEPQENYNWVKMFVASSSQPGCYLKDCIIPCCIFWPAQGAFISAAGRERERDSALESSRGFPQHLSLKEPLCILQNVFSELSKYASVKPEESGMCYVCVGALWPTELEPWWGCHSRGSLNPSEDAVLHGACTSSGSTSTPQTQGGFSPGVTNVLNPLRFASKWHFATPSLTEGQVPWFSSLPHRKSPPEVDGRVHREGHRVVCHSTQLQPPWIELRTLTGDRASITAVVQSCPRRTFVGWRLSCLAVSELLRGRTVAITQPWKQVRCCCNLGFSSQEPILCDSCPALRTWSCWRGLFQHPNFHKEMETTPQSKLW